MKTVFAALAGALGTTIACWRLILLLWLVNVAAGWVIATPLAGAIDEVYMHNPASADLLTSFDNESYVDFLGSESEAVAATADIARASALPWLLIWTVLAAGVWSRVADPRNHPGFLAACGRYGHRFVWLGALTLVGLWGLSWFNDGVTSLTTGWLVDDAHDYGPGFVGWVMHSKTLLMLASMGIVVSAGRFARLRMIHLGERLAVSSWLAALAGVVRHLPSIGLGRILSLWPLLAVWWFYDWASGALLADDALLPGMRVSWRLLLVFQLTQVLLQAALVYRMAVDARLWPIVAPARSPTQPREQPLTAPPAPAAAPVTADEATSAGEPADEEHDERDPWDTGVTEADPDAEPRSGRDEDTESTGRPVVTACWLLAALLGAGPMVAAQDVPAEEPPAAEPPAASEPAEEPAAGQQAPATPASRTDTGALSVRRNRYVMDVTVDILGHTATAQQKATFLNKTSQPVGELWLHLYATAFSHTKTQWIDAGSPERILDRGAADGGYIDIKSVRLQGGGDLAERTTIDETLMKVDLAQPVPAGGEVTLDIEFETRFPRVIARMGMTGQHLNGMQWYPKFCTHDEEQGWATDPFHAMGEFYADFGTYQVTFRYPARVDGEPVELEATGVPDEARPVGEDTLVKTYRAQDVHDFAFCADPAFVRHTDTWKDQSTGREVELVYLCQPYAVPKAQYVLDVVKTCLTASARWWMPYPYPRLVIDGQPSNRGGGMEYPMLFTISQRSPLHLDWLNDLVEDPASVTAHEFAHQYWYGIMASDEVDEAWLDEGFTTWSTVRLLEEHFPDAGRTDALTFLERTIVREALDGAHGGRLPWLESDVLSLQKVIGWRTSPFHATPPASPGAPSLLGFSVPRVSSLRLPDMSANRMAWHKRRYAQVADTHPLSAPSRDFNRGTYGPLVYSKAALVLETLNNHVGTETMEDIMRSYVERYRFQHPDRADFLGVVSEVTGGAHDALMVQLTETRATVDWAVERVSCRRDDPLAGYRPQTRPGEAIDWIEPVKRPRPAPKGVLERIWSTVFSRPLPGTPVDDAAGDAPADETGWLTRYTVRQLGQVEAPVVVEARFADGSVERQTWDGRGGYKLFEHRTPAKLVEVVVDPERLFAIDLDVNNNGHQIQPALETTRTLGALTQFWAQNHLNGWSLVF